MKKSTMLLVISAGAIMLTGCASRASGVVPVQVSSSEYSGLTCEETREELANARSREAQLSSQQNSAATADAVGVFLLFIPAGSVFGGNVEGELAQAKGEAVALQRAVRTNCAEE